jgi:hypothetical protein
MKRLLLVGAVLAGCLTAVAASATPLDLPQSYLFTQAGKLTPLHAGSTYTASLFPIPIRRRRRPPVGPARSGGPAVTTSGAEARRTTAGSTAARATSRRAA